MLSKLRPSRRRAVSAAERGGKRLWRHFRGTLPGGLVEALAFCCPNWFWKKPNLDRSDFQSAADFESAWRAGKPPLRNQDQSSGADQRPIPHSVAAVLLCGADFQ